MKKIFAILAMALMAATAVAQEYRYEVGPALGVSGYIGDISSGNMYKHPGIVGGGVFRYNMNSRIAFKGNLLYASISGNSNDCASKFPEESTMSLSRTSWTWVRRQNSTSSIMV